jgi:Carbohydrate-binding module 48 (Isoamylase N-terminal domain)
MSDETPRESERVRRAYEAARLDDAPGRKRLLERLRKEVPPRPARDDGAWGTAGFVFRPALAAAVLVIVFAVGGISGWLLAQRAPARSGLPALAAAADAGVPIVFALPAPDAERVALVGDFNSWDAETTPLHRAALGNIWTVEVTLPRGIHTYAFVVDGRSWIPDPGAPLAPVSGFGTSNSVVIVGDAAS